MTDSEFEQVRSFLAQTYGLDMNSKRTLLECRLARERDRLQLPSFSAYFDLVESARTHPIPSVRITGIDLSQPAIEEARTAAYPESRINRVPRRWRNAYFVRNGQLYTVAERIRSRVFLAQGNLCDDEVLRRTYDLIMCRNVIIYLKAEVRNRVIATLHRHLAPSSYLMLGHAEIIRERTLFEYQGNSVYRRQAKATNV